jgi:hypothetical protein
VVAAWIVCLGRRTISRAWETTGQTEQRNHAAVYRLFSEAVWNWDEVCRLLRVLIALVLHVGLVIVLAVVAPGVLLLTYLLPLMLADALAAYLFYVQHNFPSVEIRPRDEWDYTVAALRSSSYLTTGLVMRWFTGNIGYHHVPRKLRPARSLNRLNDLLSFRASALLLPSRLNCYRLE